MHLSLFCLSLDKSEWRDAAKTCGEQDRITYHQDTNRVNVEVSPAISLTSLMCCILGYLVCVCVLLKHELEGAMKSCKYYCFRKQPSPIREQKFLKDKFIGSACILCDNKHAYSFSLVSGSAVQTSVLATKMVLKF